jgi:hypothetical protein
VLHLRFGAEPSRNVRQATLPESMHLASSSLPLPMPNSVRLRDGFGCLLRFLTRLTGSSSASFPSFRPSCLCTS